ncbi:MAG TPA: LysM peptidoglycan-binding domain-containing protein [Candidatus Omnitrophota bacterium]|nr:LysM peptidoglycan-binding domain-containing protein [Candidatus Omnitrophota bacterium]HPT07856.1 LysM peptidoglycan-binding domain-containing protein [Candidatus Omnitrophota bacterium]
MKRAFGFIVVSGVFLLSGCVVRSYEATRDRIDQNLSAGNRGYIMGAKPASLSDEDRKLTRTTKVVEVELRSPLEFLNKRHAKKTVGKTADTAVEGNKGYVNEPPVEESAALSSETLESYTVQKNDTLQKISQKYFGTTKKWVAIFNVNKDKLSAPNKIYPGQVIQIPVEKNAVQEPKENLK